MVGYAKNAPKDEEWLLKEIESIMEEHDLHFAFNQPEYEHFISQIIAKIEEGGWVSPAYLKDALSREMASGFRLGLNKSKGGE